MGRGVSCGGGQSSLGYLFGSSETPTKAPTTTSNSTTATTATPTGTPSKPEEKQLPAGVRASPNNYNRTDGQNSGNFITDRPSTKVHAAPGGGSSLGYLFGGSGGNGN